jgi:hypothetical protein
MLSFEVSAIDVVLLVAVLVLLLLFISQRRGHSAAEPRLDTDVQEKLSKKKAVKVEKAAEDSVKKQSTEGFQECAHEFGYLKDMPKNTPVPDECFGCPNVLRCMFPDPVQQIQAT